MRRRSREGLLPILLGLALATAPAAGRAAAADPPEGTVTLDPVLVTAPAPLTEGLPYAF